MFKTIIASEISRKASLVPHPKGKRCWAYIDATSPVEMVYERFKGKPGGLRWFFICPVTRKRCCKLHLIGNTYQHCSVIKGYYRKMKPAWFSETPLYSILVRKQESIDAKEQMNHKHFKTYYAGKFTKRYLKCIKQIELGNGLSMHSIINGEFGK